MLKAEDLYQGNLDGIWGPLTERAADRFHALSFEIAEEHGRFDPRTESNILTLTLHAQQQARQFMARIHNNACTAVGALSPGRSEDIPTTQLISSFRRTPGSRPTQNTRNNPIVKIISGTRSYAEQNYLQMA